MATTYNINLRRFNGSDWDTLLPNPAIHASSHATDGIDPIAPADIGALADTTTAADLDVNYKFYNSVTDVGLTVQSATLAQTWAAMENYSILIAPSYEFSDTPPTSQIGHNYYKIIRITQYYGRIFCYGYTGYDYTMYINGGTGVPYGEWVLVGANVSYGYSQSLTDAQKTQARTNIGAGTPVTIDSALSSTSTNPLQNQVITSYLDDCVVQTYHNISVTCAANDVSNDAINLSKTGYTPVALSGYRFSGTGSSLFTAFRLYIADNKLHWGLRNTGTTSRTITFYYNILWVKNV